MGTPADAPSARAPAVDAAARANALVDGDACASASPPSTPTPVDSPTVGRELDEEAAGGAGAGCGGGEVRAGGGRGGRTPPRAAARRPRRARS